METVYEPLSDAKLKELAQRIEDWKNQYEDAGGVRLIEVPGDEGDDFSGIFRIPTREDLERSSRKILRRCRVKSSSACSPLLYPEPKTFRRAAAIVGIVRSLAKKLLECPGDTGKKKMRAQKIIRLRELYLVGEPAATFSFATTSRVDISKLSMTSNTACSPTLSVEKASRRSCDAIARAFGGN
jgi:hypothetical protein